MSDGAAAVASDGSGKKRKRQIKVKFDASSPPPDSKGKKSKGEGSLKMKKPSNPVSDLLSAVLQAKDQKGRLISEGLMHTPTRKQDPDFHKTIADAIDLKTIKDRVAEGCSYDDLVYDLNLLLTNTRMYYDQFNPLWADACDLTKLVNSHAMRAKLGDLFVLPRINWKAISKADGTASSELRGQMKRLIEKVKSYVKEDDVGDGYLIHEIFLKVPGKKDYPDYFKIITDPIDIVTIEKLASDSKFSTLVDFVRTFDAMFENAVAYNPPGSEVYEDALTMMKFLRNEVYSIDKSLRAALGTKQPAASLKVSVKRMTPSPGAGTLSPGAGEMKLSLKRKKVRDEDTASTKSGGSDGKRRRDDAVVIDMDEVPRYEKPAGIRSTLKYVFNILKDADNGAGVGTSMSDVFWVLPTEEELPDYYTKIARPIEMKSINGKILGNTFRNTAEFQKAVNLMCDNAMLYNIDESQEYQAAVNLKALCAEELKKADVLGIPLTEAQRAKLAKRSDRLAKKVEKDKERVGKGDLKSRRSKGDKKVTKVDMYLGLLRMLKDSETNDGSNRKLAIEFQVLPSRDDYPEYYEIIKRPIDLKTIEERVTKHRYSSAEDLMKDVNTMFANAHSFNEEGSSVYQDATELKALAHTHYLKLLELMHLDKGGIPYSAAAIAVEPERQVAISGGKRRQLKSIKADPTSMCKSILSTLERNAASAGIFGAKAKENLLLFDSLPPRKENPAYYRVVTTPIDLETIRARVDESVYTNPSHIVLDLVLLFNNARVFYDRENAIYLAATGLMQALRLAAAQVLTNQDAMAIPTLDESCPLFDIADELLVALESSPLSQHFLEVPDRRVNSTFYTKTPNALMLKDVRGKLLAKRYQSLHEFVLDVDTVFTDARKRLGRDDSVYADSIALQKLFAEALQAVLAERNITSPGCSDYDIEHVTALVTKEEALPAVAAPASTAPTDELLSDAGGYSVGEFAYVSTSGSATTSICLITKLFLREDGVEMFQGVRYLRPIETFHLTTRTFYENEVFKTKEVVSEPVTELAAKCWVLFMKDYCAYTVAEIAETDLYCCESRYIKNGKKIEKIRNFTAEGLAPELIAREPKLNLRELVKIKSPLADTDDDDDDAEAANDDAAAAMGDYPVPKLDDPRNVVQPLELLKGCTYYKTLCLDSEPFSIGDAILLRNPDERKKAFPFVALIKRMWVDDKGFPYCSGPWLARPIETHHDPSKSFYTNELLLTASSDSNSMLSIIRKCAIMQVSDYQSWRPLAIADPYVFICESRYNDKKKEIAIMKSYPDDMAEPEERIALGVTADLTKVPSPWVSSKSAGVETGTVGTVAEDKGDATEAIVGEAGVGVSQAIKNLKSQIEMTRSALNDTRKKSKKLLDRAVQQAARLAALEAGGDGTESASIKLTSLKHPPAKLDPKNEFITENFAKSKAEQPLADDRVIRDKLTKVWATLMPAEKSAYIQKATRKDEIVGSAYAAAIVERDTYQPPPTTAAPKPAAVQQSSYSGAAAAVVAAPVSAASVMPISNGMSTVDSAMASTALATEQQRNPNGYALSQAYELRIAAELKAFKMSNAAPIKLTHEEQRSLRDATIPAPSVASTSIAATLASFQEAIDGDNSALQKVFAGW